MASLSTNPIHVQLSPQFDPTLSHLKWQGPILGHDVLEREVQWIELTFYEPKVEMFIIQHIIPIQPMLRVWAKEKLVAISSS